jgi:hypothetical protein
MPFPGTAAIPIALIDVLGLQALPMFITIAVIRILASHL